MIPSKATSAAAAAPPTSSSTPTTGVTPTKSSSTPPAAAAAAATAVPVSPTATAAAAIPSGGGNAKKIDASCRSCARLVQEILQNPNSRPRQIIQSLIVGMATPATGTTTKPQRHNNNNNNTLVVEQESFRLKPVEDGLQVQLRVLDKPYESSRRWTSVAPPNDHNNNSQTQQQHTGGFLPLQQHLPPVMATSSSSSSSTSASSSSSSSPDDPKSQIQSTLEDQSKKLEQQQQAQQPQPPRYITETIKIECRPCDTVGAERGARALIIGPKPLSIVACTNRLTPNDRDEMSQVLVHELLHAYDVKKLNLDFSDCESMAYSEVRAAREAECHPGNYGDGFGARVMSKTYIGGGLTEYCVKRLAIAAAHNLFPTQGRQCVGTVFKAAYNDPRPFQDIQLQNYYNSQQQQKLQQRSKVQNLKQQQQSSTYSSSSSNNISSTPSSLLAQQPTRRSTMHEIPHSNR